MWRSFLNLNHTDRKEEDEKKPVVDEVLVKNSTTVITPKKLWEEKQSKMADEEIKALAKKRSQAKGKLTRIWNAVSPSAETEAASSDVDQVDVSLPQLKVHQRNEEKYYGEFYEVHDQIMTLVAGAEEKQQEAKMMEFEQLYKKTLVRLETLLVTYNRPAGSTQAVLPAGQAPQQVIIHQQALRAPLPTFDGRYENWAKFKSMFQDLMRNSHDSDAIKLYHLDQALVGQAKGKIDARTIQDNKYQQAWNNLEERYENKRLIIDLHIQGILQLKKMDKRSSTELREVIEECSRHVENLRFHEQELLGVSELFVVNILASTLDRETRELWEATIEQGELPQYQATLDFLKKRCFILERCEAAHPETAKPAVSNILHSTKPSTNVSVAATTAREAVCELCGGGHLNYRCSAFQSMTVQQRLTKVSEARVYYNCLRSGHLVKNCPSDRSCKCGARHHNLLHVDQSKQQAPNPEAAAKPQPTTEQGGPSNTSVAAVETSEETTLCCRSGLLQTTRPVLLQTAIIDVLDKHGRPHPCRTLLDSGSQAHILSAAMARTLDLPLTKCNVTVVFSECRQDPSEERCQPKLLFEIQQLSGQHFLYHLGEANRHDPV